MKDKIIQILKEAAPPHSPFGEHIDDWEKRYNELLEKCYAKIASLSSGGVGEKCELLEAIEEWVKDIPWVKDTPTTISEGELIEFGNACWWESKRYWEEHPDGNATAKTIKSILKESKLSQSSKPITQDDEAHESVFHKNTDYTNLMNINQFKAALKELGEKEGGEG
jgi:hypothetical protein